jgi:hypothetical protein
MCAQIEAPSPFDCAGPANVRAQATVIDFDLAQPEERRESLDHMERIFGLIRQAKAWLIPA